MIDVGPYRFTEQDARRTLSALGSLWDPLLEGRSSAAATSIHDALRVRLVGAAGLPIGTSMATIGRQLASNRSSNGVPPEVLSAVLADAWHALRLASDALRADGQLPSRQVGTVRQLSVSKGGVPKVAVDSADVGFAGIVGDVQRTRLHHGRPWQALCLLADEVIDTFQAEGHPVDRGSLGENVTIAGLDWSQVRPGVRLQLGTVVAHVQAFTEPCRKNARFFLGGDFQRMNIDRGPVSRVYATVLRPGRITSGDEAVLEPTVELGG